MAVAVCALVPPALAVALESANNIPIDETAVKMQVKYSRVARRDQGPCPHATAVIKESPVVQDIRVRRLDIVW